MINTPLVIIGKHGMLGQDLAKEFADISPILLDKEDVDITNIDAVRQTLGTIKPGTIINAAGYNAVDDAEEEPGNTIAQKVNGDGPANIATVAQELGATFVHYSSDYVFDGTKKEGYTEDDTPNPQSNYARSKLAGEQTTVAHGGYAIRTCKLFGDPGQSPVSKKSFVDTMLDLAEKNDTLNIVNEEYASPTYTPDLAAQTRALLEGDYQPGVYHITNSDACTWYEFAVEIFRLANKTVTVNPVSADAFPRPAARPAYSQLLNTKLPPMRSWKQALAEYIQPQRY